MSVISSLTGAGKRLAGAVATLLPRPPWRETERPGIDGRRQGDLDHEDLRRIPRTRKDGRGGVPVTGPGSTTPARAPIHPRGEGDARPADGHPRLAEYGRPTRPLPTPIRGITDRACGLHLRCPREG